MLKKDFRGEVWVNVHPDLLAEIVRVNALPIDGGYGADGFAEKATALMQRNFHNKIATTFAINGTAANVMALKVMLDRWSTVICAKQAHIDTYEAGALEFNLGNKTLPIECEDGKLTPALIERFLRSVRNYKYLPKVIAITQPTEYGTVYTEAEIGALCDFAHGRGLFVYVDGARIGNGVAALGTNLTDMIEKTGVDAFSFGGTKVGAMMGEMVIFLREEFAAPLAYSQKQSMQHMSKSKFLSAQMAKILETDLWLKNAAKGNAMAKYLANKLAQKGIGTAYEVQANMVFAVIDADTFAHITRVYDLHYWDEDRHVVRLATTHETDEKAVDELVSLI